jgi:hypothetical protein
VESWESPRKPSIRFGAVAQHAQQHAEHALLIEQHEAVERGFVTAFEAFDEVAFLGVDHGAACRTFSACARAEHIDRGQRRTIHQGGHILADTAWAEKFRRLTG